MTMTDANMKADRATASLIAAIEPMTWHVATATTDIVYLNHGMPEPRGFTDRERMKTGELVYTGVRRTPICAKP